MKRSLMICFSLLLTVCIVLLSWLLFYRSNTVYSYSELEFDQFDLEGSVLTFRVCTEEEGAFVYEITTSMEENDLLLTVRGGKQPSLAMTPGEKYATFTVTLPDEVKHVRCGNRNVYTVH